jgi:hypothetical protein
MTGLILGGGASVNDIDLNRIRRAGRPIIGVNGAALAARCDMLFSLDRPFMKTERSGIITFPGGKHICLFPHHMTETWPDVTIWRRQIDDIPATEPGVISAPASVGNGGLAAINLAMQLGHRRIVLLGFDMDMDNRHFYPGTAQARTGLSDVLAALTKVAAWYERNGIEIMNASPDSAITCFPKVAADTFYA